MEGPIQSSGYRIALLKMWGNLQNYGSNFNARIGRTFNPCSWMRRGFYRSCPDSKNKRSRRVLEIGNHMNRSNKARIKRIVEKWRPRLFLGEWHISLSYPKEDVEARGSGQCLAEVSVNPVYMNAVISIYPALFKKTNEVQEHAIVHELCHCLTQEVWELMDMQHRGAAVGEHFQRESVERLTQRIANAVFYGPKR